MASSETNASVDQTDGGPKLSQTRLYVLALAISVTNLAVAFDTTILGPAIPTITSEFGTIDHIGWYTSAYLLGVVSCQPFFARLILYYEQKWFYMICVLVLELGSVICATAPSSQVLIFGRAISGCGAAGITAGAFALVGQHAPMRERPRIIAMFAAVQSLAYSSGPTISGVFTGSSVTWRFNFWINLPIGFLSLVFVWFAVPTTANVRKVLPLLEKLKRSDPLGTILLTLCLVPLFLALEWGGNVAPFSSPRVWGCFLASGIFAIGFAALLAIKKDNAVVPLRILKQRTVAICICFSALYGMANMIHGSMLATYFQTVHNISITLSAVYQIPLTVSSIFSSVVASIAISAWGHYLPFFWAGPPLYLVGAVLLHTLSTTSNVGQLMGYQVPAGIGFGTAVSVTLIAIQAVSTPDDLTSACVADVVAAQVGRAVGISIAQNLFVGLLNQGLRDIVSPEQAASFARNGLERMIESMKTMDVGLRQQFREALNKAVATSLLVPVAAISLAIIATWFAERRTLITKTVVETRPVSTEHLSTEKSSGKDNSPTHQTQDVLDGIKLP
ncbi:hypothetical protein V496_02610 [Pseudogymnoascus sp. VKM F-4515 (FW-2607)]|nr:hypothetical protein V496_02610 [Pseudogymnoascus sp. VKM F-4515 (FW-2607)]